MSILFDNARILQPDGTVQPGVVAVEGALIRYAGPKSGLEQRMRKTVDCKNGILMPGLANAHTHLGMTVFRGFCNHLPLEEWLHQVWALEDQLTEEDVYWASLLSIMEMTASGATCFLDMYFHMEAVARAVADSGMRGVLSRGLQSLGAPGNRVQEAKELHSNWHGAGGRITTMVGPHSVYTCDEAMLRQSVALSEELGVGLHIHLCESRQEVADCQQAHSCSPVALCEQFGLFDRPVVVGHGVELTEADMDILAKYNVTVAHCPGSNLKLGNGIAPVTALQQRGINVALGTDSAASNNNLDVWEEMQTASLLQKLALRDAGALSAQQTLAMATRNGYAGLQIDNAGALAAGKAADMVLVRTDRPVFQPGLDAAADLVFAANRADIAMTMVAGRILYDHGQWPTIEVEDVLRNIQRTAARLFRE